MVALLAAGSRLTAEMCIVPEGKLGAKVSEDALLSVTIHRRWLVSQTAAARQQCLGFPVREQQLPPLSLSQCLTHKERDRVTQTKNSSFCEFSWLALALSRHAMCSPPQHPSAPLSVRVGGRLGTTHPSPRFCARSRRCGERLLTSPPPAGKKLVSVRVFGMPPPPKEKSKPLPCIVRLTQTHTQSVAL